MESIILIGADNLHNKELKNVFEPTDVTIDRSIPRVLKVDFPDALYALESLVKITEPVIIVDRKAEAKNIQDIRVISRHRVPFDIPIGRYRLFKEEYTPIATEFLFCRFIVPSDLQKVHFISSEKATAEEEDDKEYVSVVLLHLKDISLPEPNHRAHSKPSAFPPMAANDSRSTNLVCIQNPEVLRRNPPRSTSIFDRK